MKKFGNWSEQTDTVFRTSGDNREVTITPPSTLTGPSTSNSFTTPSITGTSDNLISRISVDQTTGRLQNKDLSTNNVGFVDNSDTSKKLLFNISAFSTSTTHTLTVPNVTGTVVLEGNTATLTNKTIDGDDNTVLDLALASLKTTANLNVFLQRDGSGDVIDSTKAVPSGDVVGTSDTQTLSGKTLTLPQINDTSSDHQYVVAVNELAADRTVTLPLLTGNDTFVFEAHAQTLTNKTIDGSSNTISNIDLTSQITGTLPIANGGTNGITATAGFDNLSPNTTKGDIVVYNGSNNIRLPVGGDGQVLAADSAQASGLNWSSPLVNPMDSVGDLIIGSTGGAAARLDSGGANTVLVNATANTITWSDVPQTVGMVQLDYHVIKSENTSSYTIDTDESMTHSFMEVATATTVTVDGKLGVIDSVTVNGTGTLTINGDCKIV